MDTYIAVTFLVSVAVGIITAMGNPLHEDVVGAMFIGVMSMLGTLAFGAILAGCIEAIGHLIQ